MDWTNKTYHFKCKPTKLTAAPSDENYVLFRKSYNDWCKGSPAEDEIGPRGAPIGPYGRLQNDIWAAMFELYEHNLRQELGEDAAAVQALRGKVVWVDEGAKFVGYGESHPTAKNTIDGTRSQADRRVEVFLFDEKDAPDLETTQGADVYDGVTFERKTVEPLLSAKPWKAYWEVMLDSNTGEELPARMGDVRRMILEAPGLGEGVEVRFLVTQLVNSSNARPAGSFITRANASKALADYFEWFDENRVIRQADNAIPDVSFTFDAEAAGRLVHVNAPLIYADTLEATLKDKLSGEHLAHVKCKIFSPWCDGEIASDDNAKIVYGNLPPGGVVVARRQRLITS
jgi:hypothetical protein